MTVQEIGAAAGRIWRTLEAKGRMPLSQLRSEAELSERLVHAGLGWLAREDKVGLEIDGRTVMVQLR